MSKRPLKQLAADLTRLDRMRGPERDDMAVSISKKYNGVTISELRKMLIPRRPLPYREVIGQELGMDVNYLLRVYESNEFEYRPNSGMETAQQTIMLALIEYVYQNVTGKPLVSKINTTEVS